MYISPMRKLLAVGLTALSSVLAIPQSTKPVTTIERIVIGRHTFFDFGPPNNYYEIYIVEKSGEETAVRRITATPSAGNCMPPGIEVQSGQLHTSIAQLLEEKDPCTIRDKDLQRERRRAKRGPVFSGAITTLEISCSGKERLIETRVFDRDWFAKQLGTPENTSWTMRVLGRLDEATGPTVMEKPVFPIASPNQPQGTTVDAQLAEDLRTGKYDALFGRAPDKVSELYQASVVPHLSPTVTLTSESANPMNAEPIPYPPIARLANVSGVVQIVVLVGQNGRSTDIQIENGHPMLKPVVESAAAHWRFDPKFAGQEVHIAIDFETNCVRK